MIIQPGSKLLFIGDSITDCDRARRVEGSLGNGYVSLVDGLISATYPGIGIRAINRGISGNTVRDLKARWQRDALDLGPDWLSIMIGINDVWRRFGTRAQLKEHVPLDEYASTLEELVRDTLPRLRGLVLMTPYYIEPDRADPMRKMMDEYGAVVRDLAGRYGAVCVDTQAAFDAVLEKVGSETLADDKVHPNLTGHFVIARAFLRAVDGRQ